MNDSDATISAITPNRPQALRSYLPETLLKSAPRHDSALWYEWIEGSLMHCDISGFTAMSENLAGRGKEGAELMVGVLNHFFEVMLGIASDYGGVQMKFGGDAMLLYFGEEAHASRAAGCGLAMQNAMKAFAKVDAGGGTYKLRMRAGIHSGRFFSASVGDPDQLLHYVLIGADVNTAAAVEAAAGLGQVVCTPATEALLRQAKVRPHTNGLLRIEDLDTLPPLVRLRPPDRSTTYERYLPAVIREGRTAGSGEHRRITIAFINVLGTGTLLETSSEDEVLDVLNRFVVLILDILERHGGYLLGSDVADDGDKFFGLFGAPIANEHQEAAALRFALDLHSAVDQAGLPLKLRTGINTGYAFAGEVGSADRHEYTVIGDSVNLSARLMAAAGDGQVIVSKTTADRVLGQFQLKTLKPVRVKGKKEPIAIRRLVGAAEPSMVARDTRLVGRDSESRGILRLSGDGAKRGRSALVYGDPGIGKSALMNAVMSNLGHGGWTIVCAACQPHTSGTPFEPWLQIASELANRGGETAKHARALITLLRNPPGADGDPRTFRSTAMAAIGELVTQSGRTRPTAIHIEDIHWADDSSLAAIGAVTHKAAANTLLFLTSREPAPDIPVSRVLHLEPLSDEAAAELVASSDVAPDDASTVLAKAGGNPLFLTEYLRSGATAGHLPDTVNDLMMARIDSLVPDERQVLRTASVLGQRFEQPLLVRLAEPLPARTIASAMPSLTERGFTRLESPDPPTFAFTHALLSDVAYQSAPFAFRRRVHARAGELIEAEHRDEVELVAELLLHHFEKAENLPRTVRYAAMSGERAARVFANRESMAYFQKALAALEQLPRAGLDRSLVLERRGDILEITGRHTEAVAELKRSLEVWQSTAQRPRALYTRWPTSRTEREAIICRKIAASRERTAEYDEALAWLERARAVTPARSARLRAQISATTCVSHFRKGDYTEAIDWGRQAVLLARRAHDDKLLAYAHNMLSNALIETGRLQEATRHLRPAVRLYHELRDYSGQASANNNLGSCYQLLGMYDAALYHYEMAQLADERSGDEIDSAIVHNNMAETLLLLDREEEAVSRLEQVLRIADKEPDLADLAAWAHVVTGRAYRALGQLPDAKRHLRSGVRKLRALESRGLLSEALVDMAEQALAEGDASGARRRARSALRHAHEITARLPEARALRVLGECDAIDGRKTAERHLRASIDISRRVDAGHEEARAQMALGQYYLHTDRRRSAQWPLRRAMRIFIRAGASRQAETAAKLLDEAQA